MSVVDEIFARLPRVREAAYLGEPVSLAEHMLQTAFAAERDGAPTTLVAAALLHDYGHLIHDLPEDAADHGLDTHHEDVGLRVPGTHFGPEVVEPVRLHVAAKRYLCAVDPSTSRRCRPPRSTASSSRADRTTPGEVAAFEASPFAADAVRLRRYDDIGKVAGADTPDLEHYRPALEAALR